VFSSGLSLAVQRFSQSLQEFQLECIGDAETDDEINIGETKHVPDRLSKLSNVTRFDPFYVSHFFCSSVLKGVLPAFKYHGRGEKTTGKNVSKAVKNSVFMC